MSMRSYTLKEIESGLRNSKYYYNSAGAGNVDALIHMMDSEYALQCAEPTEAQMLAVELVWRQERTLTEAGEILGITPQGVRFNLQLLSIKLKKVVDEWKEIEGRERHD